MGLGLINGGLVFNNGALGDCECCGCDDPMMDVTVSWTDADTTKSYLGQTFTNGQTIGICPSEYECTNAGNVRQEIWKEQGLADPVTFGDRSPVFKYGTGTAYPYNYTSTNTYTPYNQGRRKLSFLFRSMTQTGAINRILSQEARMNFGDFAPNTNDAHAYANSRHIDQFATGNRELTFRHFKHQVAPPLIQATTKVGITDDYNSSYTTSNGVTVAWSLNHTGKPWGDCF